EILKAEDKFKIIDKNIPSKNSDITIVAACELFLEIKQKTLTEASFQAYKTFVYSKIIPYFKKFQLKDITIQDIQKFKKYLQENKVSERRIKNILALLNQIIKYFQDEGYIDKTCVFEVKRIADIPKRQIQILTPEQLAQLFKILKKKYPYMLPIVHKLITLKQPLNTILTEHEQQKKSLKRKIRKDFYKVKQEFGLTNYMLDDLRFSDFVK
ncbi:tyrosine-type recombinase/integrase family protein, partial [bacterium]|nr:tyrosine-type recombinase/integrase family protein [bacterium]